MKKTITILSIISIIMLMSFNANATIWRVNADTNVDADYHTIQAAHTVASAGDTIYVEAGEYGETEISKQLTIIGSGTHGDPDLNLDICYISGLTINAGAEGSYINSIRANYVYVDCSDITIANLTVTVSFNVQAARTNILTTNSELSKLSGVSSCSNIIFRNCIIYDGNYHFYNASFDYCYLSGGLGLENCYITNSVIQSLGYYFSVSNNNDISNSICLQEYQAGYYAGTDNYFFSPTISSSDFFESTVDYTIKPTLDGGLPNPAMTQSIDGGEVGIHGGSTPFDDRMFPLNMPVIEKLIVPSISNDQMQVEVKAKVLE